MEEKRGEAGTAPAAGAESPASEPSSSRRRAGGQKRKASNLGASNSSSAPSKRATREKALLSHPPIHNGPLTRARQGPSNHAASAPSPRGGAAALARKPNELAAAAEVKSKESELEALEAAMGAEFEAIRSRGANVHVVPRHCGWFSWTKVHPIEERTLPSFFNEKSETRTPDMYMEIRNWIMKKFHSNPNTQVELKDLSELDVGDSEARQEVMEFLDHWGLINFHPFPPTDSVVSSAENDDAAKGDSLVEKLFRFETPELCLPAVPKTNLTTPSMSSGFFPESAIAEELARAEGPAVEYHCNSCGADCSRKRYHCQKQADFDLCTDCFNNGKFGSGMSSSDFILMEPAEAPGLSSGKWTDQETLLLLEALELYKENWSEIAEHVATKTKAQCILHFLQMPIEDTFLDCDDDIDASSKEAADPSSMNNDSSAPKDAPESKEIKAGASEGQRLTSPMETSNTEDTSEVKASDESRPEDASEMKVGLETSGPEETSEVKGDQDVGQNWALKALREAFEAVGYPPAPDNPLSFTEVGNPVMALAVFLARLVGPDLAIASTHSSLKSLSGSSPAIQLVARHCILLEDPPDDKKEPVGSERDDQEDGNLEGRSQKEDNSPSVMDDRDLSNGHNSKEIKDSTPEETQNGESTGKPHAAEEQDVIASSEEVRRHDSGDTRNSGLPKDHPQSAVKELDNSTSKVDLPSRSVDQPQETVGGPSQAAEAPKDIHMVSDSLSTEKNELQQPVQSDPVGEPPQSTVAPRDADVSSDSVPLEKNGPDQPGTNGSVGKHPQQSTDAPMDVDIVSESLPSKKNESPEPVTKSSVEEPSHPTDAAQGVDVASDSLLSKKNEPQRSVTTNTMVQNGPSEVEDLMEDGKKVKPDIRERTPENKFDKVKRAAVTALSAAAVKAKLLANQEEDQIRQLAAFMIEKQLHKLETKLAFFNEMEHVVSRVREQLDRSRQRLYHERAQIIAARLGVQASSSRPMPSSLPANRIATNFANSVGRSPMNMTYQRPQILRPMGSMAPTPHPFTPNTVTGSSVRPPSQDKLSSVVTK